MTVTFTLGWWLPTLLLFVAGATWFWVGSRESGIFGGIFQFCIGGACWFAALCCIATKVLA